MNAADCLGKKRGNAQNFQLAFDVAGVRNRVGRDQLLDRAVQKVRSRLVRQQAVGNNRIDFRGAFALEQIRRGAERSGRRGKVIHNHAGASVDVADEVRGFNRRGVHAAFRDDRKTAVETVREAVRHLDAAGVGGNDDGFLIDFDHFAQILDEDRERVEVVDGDVEESLNLLSMEIHAENPVCAGADEQIRDELGGNGYAGAVLAVLTGISVIGDDDGDAGRGSTAGGVEHDEQFHEMLIDGAASGLNDEHVRIAEIVLVLDENFAVGEPFDVDVTEFHPQTLCDRFSQFRVRCTAVQSDVSCITFHNDSALPPLMQSLFVREPCLIAERCGTRRRGDAPAFASTFWVCPFVLRVRTCILYKRIKVDNSRVNRII